jgi:penicillin-insensitive murein endopeptidase
VALPLEGAGFVFNPAKNPQARHGTVELVQALVRAGVAVGRTHPGSPLYINDLSMPRGGDIPGHASHRSGRDADVLFFLLGRDGQPIAPKPIPLDEAGNGTDFGDLSDPSDDVHVRLDVARTWAFAQHLVADPDVRLNRIFVAEHIRSLLLEYGRTHGAPKAALERFGDVTCQPGFPHDDHFHIRVFCSPDDIEAGCLDTPPIYPWHRKELQRLGVTPQLAGRRESPRPKLTSQAEAQARAKERHGAFHDDVVEFLERRKAWVSKPHPGRPFCR